MTVWASLRTHASTWIDDVATGLALLGAMLRRSRRIELVEQADGSFLVMDMSKQAAEGTYAPSLRLDESGSADQISPRNAIAACAKLGRCHARAVALHIPLA